MFSNTVSFLKKFAFCCGLFSGAISLCASKAIAQSAPAKAWDRIIGGVDSDLVGGLMQTPDGGYILGSYSKSGIGGDKSQAGRGMEDYWVVKVDANGIKTWDKTFGGISWDYLSCIKATSDGGYVMGGTSLSDANGDKTGIRRGNSDIWIVKLDANGNKVWDKTFGGDLGDGIDDMQQTSDGGYILGGTSHSSISFDKSQPNRGANNTSDYWLVKIDAQGNKIWDKTLGGNGNDDLRSVKQTSDGGFILGGESDSGISGEKTAACRGLLDYWIVKVDAFGNKQWDRTFGGNSIEMFAEVQQTTDGGYIVGGYSQSPLSGDKSDPSLGSDDLWILKLDNSGNKFWDKVIGTSSDDELCSLQQTQDGGFILGSRTDSGVNGHKTEPSRGGKDNWLVKLDATGNKLWDKAFGGNNNDYLVNMRQTTDGGYVMAGNIYYSTGGDVTGISKGSSDLWLVKTTADPLGMPELNDLPRIRIYPNPGKDKLHVVFLGNFNRTSAITFTDLLGRKILERTVVDLENVTFQLPETKGVYLLQVADKQGSISKKIIVE